MGERARPCHAVSAPGDMAVADLELDPTGYAFLSAVRFFFLSFANSDTCAWVTAVLASDSFFPGRDHAEKMRCALAIVHEMRASRQSTLRFSNPRCEGCAAIITQDERYLVQMVQAVRAGRMSRAMSHSMLLCEGNPVDRLIIAAQDFAALCPAPASEPALD